MKMDIDKKAKELLEEAKKLRKGESKDASSAPSAETKKTKEELEKEKLDKEKVDLEAKAKQDEEILKKKDEELDADEKKRKGELLEVQKKDDEKKEKSNVQKRIDELTASRKTLEKDVLAEKADKEAIKAQLAKVEAELGTLKKDLSKTPQDILKENIKKEMSTRREKYIEEDKKLDKTERREMIQEELDEWKNEDWDSANEWITRRSLRRVREEEGYVQQKRDGEMFSNLLKKQSESEKKLIEKHPELNVAERTKALEEEGKKPDEIFKTLCEENPKYKLASEILKSSPEKFVLSEKGPELISEELDKRLSKVNETSEVEEMKKELAEVKAELERVKSLDSPITSNRSSETKNEPEMTSELRNLSKELGLDENKVIARAKKREESGGR